MADKQSALAIVLKAVDQTAATMRAVDGRIKKLTEPKKIKIEDPFQSIRDRLDDIGKSTGLTALMGLGGVLKGILSTVMEVAAGAVSGVLSLVRHFDDMGDKAEKLQVTVDFLQAMRFAAERSGSSVETLDQGLTAFGENMGQLRGGTGRMLKSLQAWAPALVPMLKATRGNEAAFRLLADAMSKITDPQKRLALAMKTVGNSELAPLLARGSKGLLEMQGEFIGLAGSQEGAAEAGGAVDDALRNLKASGEGLKAALMVGLAPALQKIIPMMTEWLSGHREQIAAWLADFGDKLPGAVDRVVDAIQGAIKWVNEIVDDFGGWDQVGRALRDVMKGGLVAAMFAVQSTAQTIGVTVKALMLAWDVSPIKAVIEWFGKLGDFLDSIGVKLEHVLNLFLQIMNLPGLNQLLPENTTPSIDKFDVRSSPQPVFEDRAFRGAHPLESNPFARSAAAAAAGPQQAKITIDIKGAPRGTTTTTDPRSTADVDVTTGYQLAYYGAM